MGSLRARAPTETMLFLAAITVVGSLFAWAQQSTGTWVRLTLAAGATQAVRANVYTLTTCFRRVDPPQTGRGDAAASTRMCRSEDARRRRGCDADMPQR